MPSTQPEPRPDSLADRPEWIASLVQAWTEPLAVLDLQGRVLVHNDALRGGESGRDFLDLVYPDDVPSMKRALELWLQEGCPRGAAIEARLRADSPIYLWHPTELRSEDDELRALGLLGRDITQRRRYEQALEENELRARALLAEVLDPLVIMDAYGIVQSASDSTTGLLGYAPAELVGRNISILMPEPHHSSHDAYLANYRRTGLTKILNNTREFEVVHKGGHLVSIELSVSRVDIPGREEPLFTGSFRDISSRKEAEARLVESETMLRAIFEQEHQVVCVLDPIGKVIDVNERFVGVFGGERAEVVGEGFTACLPAELEGELERIGEAVRSASQGSFSRFSVQLSSPLGKRHLDLCFKPVEVSDRVNFVLFEAGDITEIEESRRRESELLQGLASIGESAAILAHEIRTPVSAVHHALRAVAEKLGQEDREVLGDLEQRMRRLEGTLQATLSFVKPIDLQQGPCVLPDLTQQAVEELAHEASAAGVDVRVEEGEELVFSADRQRLSEVLSNLIGNAIAVLEPGGQITVSHRRSGERVVLLVADDGPGIPADRVEQLFEPFVSGRDGGTGLGLAIARKLVEAHGGELSCVESPLRGAAFQLEIPLRPEKS